MLRDATAGGPDIRAITDLGNVAIENRLPPHVELRLRPGDDRRRSPAGGPHLRRARPDLRARRGVSSCWKLTEFTHLIATHAGPDRSAFLSSFFALVGTHGLHVTLGLVWLGGLLFRLSRMGFTAGTQRGFLLFGLFWHLIDIVWVVVFSVVYLIGASK